jgi:hypothetical protein
MNPQIVTELKMYIRPISELGGNETAYGISVLNDTGSDTMPVFKHRLASISALRITSSY